jgi:hypothetical protein
MNETTKLKLGNSIAVWKKISKDCRAVAHPKIGENFLFADENGDIIKTTIIEEVLEYEAYIMIRTKNSIYKIVRT